MGLFQRATKEESKLRLGIVGPSGSGKTYTALMIAHHLANGEPIALVDTENGSASKYADQVDFDVANMHAPFHPDKFIKALKEAQGAGYGVVILDSISHAWSGTGGVLDVVDEAAKRSKSGNSYTAWREGTPLQNQLIDAIVQSGIHVIVTMRSKTEYVLQDDGRGKKAPKKVGMAPVQRDQFEYELDVVMEMDVENNGIISKTRCPALSNRVFKQPGEEVAGILREWLSGAPKKDAPQQQPSPQPDPEPQPASATPSSDDDVQFMADDAEPAQADEPDNPFESSEPEPEQESNISRLRRQFHALGTEVYAGEWDDKRHALVQHISGGKKSSSNELTEKQLEKLIGGMQEKRQQAQPA